MNIFCIAFYTFTAAFGNSVAVRLLTRYDDDSACVEYFLVCPRAASCQTSENQHHRKSRVSLSHPAFRLSVCQPACLSACPAFGEKQLRWAAAATRPNIAKFQSLKIRGSTILNYIKFPDPRSFKLCQMFKTLLADNCWIALQLSTKHSTSKFVNWQLLWSSETAIGGFWGSEICVKFGRAELQPQSEMLQHGANIFPYCLGKKNSNSLASTLD